MKKKLYLITNDFPYGKGETSFIMPELPSLKKEFDITVISNSLDDEQTVILDEDIRVIHYDRKASLLWKIWDSFCYLGSRDAYWEMWEIIHSGKMMAKRLAECVLFYEKARRFRRFLKKNQVIDDSEPAIIYNYWFTYYCLTTVHLYESNPNVHVITSFTMKLE